MRTDCLVPRPWACVTGVLVAAICGCASGGGLSGASSDGEASTGSNSRSEGSSHRSGESSADSGGPSRGSAGSSDSRSKSEGSSDSNSETSGTVTTEGQRADAVNATATLITVGVALVGATVAAVSIAHSLRQTTEHVEARRRSIRADLVRGSGPFVRELGGRLGLDAPTTSRLGAWLKGHRDDLDRHLRLAEPLDAARTEAFLLALVDVLRRDPTLRQHVERLAIRVGGVFPRVR